MFYRSANFLEEVIRKFLGRNRFDVAVYLFNIQEVEEAGYTEEVINKIENETDYSFVSFPSIKLISVKESILSGAYIEVRGITGTPMAYAKANVINLPTLVTIPYAIPELQDTAIDGMITGKLESRFGKERAIEIFDEKFSEQDFSLDLEFKNRLKSTLLHEYFHTLLSHLFPLANKFDETNRELLNMEVKKEEKLATEFSKEFYSEYKLPREGFKKALVRDLVETDWKRINKGEKAAYPKIVDEYNRMFG